MSQSFPLLSRAAMLLLVAAASLFSATTASAGLIAAAPNDLSVTQTVTPVGPHTWHYSFSFVNTGPANLWHFLVYTPFPTFNGTAIGLPNAALVGLSLDSVFYPYDARNVDASLTTETNMFTPAFGFGGIPMGGSGMLAFDANTFVAKPFLYAYELEGNYAGGGSGPEGSLGEVHVVGSAITEAVPEPASILVFGAAALGVVSVRRRAKPVATA